MEAAPAVAPASWAIMYPGTSRHGNWPDTAKGTLVPAAITPVAAAEPAPTNTRNAVPRNSAASFWGVVGGAAMWLALGRPSGGGFSPPSGEMGSCSKRVRHRRTVFHET